MRSQGVLHTTRDGGKSDAAAALAVCSCWAVCGGNGPCFPTVCAATVGKLRVRHCKPGGKRAPMDNAPPSRRVRHVSPSFTPAVTLIAAEHTFLPGTQVTAVIIEQRFDGCAARYVAHPDVTVSVSEAGACRCLGTWREGTGAGCAAVGHLQLNVPSGPLQVLRKTRPCAP